MTRNSGVFYTTLALAFARTHKLYRPLHDMLREAHERVRRPLFIAETGIEDAARPEWLRQEETSASLLYPRLFTRLPWPDTGSG